MLLPDAKVGRAKRTHGVLSSWEGARRQSLLLRLLASAVVLGLGMPACVTSSKRAKRGELVDKSGGKQARRNKRPRSRVRQPLTKVKKSPSAREQLEFVKKQTGDDPEFDVREKAFVSSLPKNPRGGSIHEAALAIGLTKLVLNAKDSPSFEEEDLTESAQPSSDPDGLSLEKLCDQYNLRLADAIMANHFLQGPQVSMEILDALSLGNNSDDFRTEIESAVKAHVNGWNDVARKVGSGASRIIDASGHSSRPAAPGAATRHVDEGGSDR